MRFAALYGFSAVPHSMQNFAPGAGVVPHLGPAGEPGARYAHVRDPWGNEIVFAETPRG